MRRYNILCPERFEDYDGCGPARQPRRAISTATGYKRTHAVPTRARPVGRQVCTPIILFDNLSAIVM